MLEIDSTPDLAVVTDPVDAPAVRPSGLSRLGEDLRAVLPSYVVARVLVLLSWILSAAVINWVEPGGRTIYQTAGLTTWDGLFYRDITELGYGGVDPLALRFFPLFPLISRALLPFVAGNATVAVVLVANVAALGAGILLRRLVLFERGPGATALAGRAVWLLNLSPASFVLVWAYSEGLFLVLAIGALFAARRGWFAVAGTAALGAALTRPIGMLLAAPLFIEAVRPWVPRLGGHRKLSDLSLREGAARVWAVAGAAVGLGLFLGWIGRTFGDPMLPFSAQGNFRTTMDPLRRLGRGLIDMIGTERFGDGMHIPFVLGFLVLLVVVARRWPGSYALYAGLVLLVTISSDYLGSTERYGLLNAFPLLLGFADVLKTRRRELIALALCANGFVALCTLAWNAAYVP